MRKRLGFLGIAALTCAAMVSAAVVQQKPAADAPAPKADTPAAKSGAPVAKAEDPATKAVRETLITFTKAYNAADVKAIAGMLSDEAAVIDSNGDEVRGKAAVIAMYKAGFEEASGVSLEAEVDDIRLITPDVARVEGRSRLTSENGDANEFHRFNVLLVRKDDQWRIDEIRDYPMPVEDVTPYERLQELEWLVGDWVDEDAENKVTANIRWTENDSYLIRTYSVELQGQQATSGTMFIGWDPETGQIKSWLFDSEGGHGEGLWTRSAPNQWIVKTRGVLHDGSATSATQIHTIVNNDAVKTSSIDRVLGGRLAPDVPEILMVRKPPQPAVEVEEKEAKPAPAIDADRF